MNFFFFFAYKIYKVKAGIVSLKDYLGTVLQPLVRLVWVSHSQFFEWQAGFIKLRQPSTHDFRGHLSMQTVTQADAARSHSDSILIFHLEGHRSTKTALHHEVFLPTALVPVVGVPRIIGSHHRGKWEQAGTSLTMKDLFFLKRMLYILPS